MELYSVIKTLHIVSATVLFGTGASIAFFMQGQLNGAAPVRRFAASATVSADFLFALPAVLIQPTTGVWPIWHGGFDPADLWLVATYALNIVAGLCWVPVVLIQIRIKRLLDAPEPAPAGDVATLNRLMRWWFFLGWPAFAGLAATFYLMVAKPSW